MVARLDTDTWVRNVNKLAAEIDEAAASLHPSAWAEQLAPLHDRYRKVAGQAVKQQQLSLFDAPQPPQPAVRPAARPVTQAPATAVAGLGTQARPGDWVRFDTRKSKLAGHPGKSAGHVHAIVPDKPFPVSGLLVYYGDREAPPSAWTYVSGGFDAPHPLAAVAELWRKDNAGIWFQIK